MKAAPLVSVILPVYNNAATVRRAVRSILRQTFSDLELIILDDGSEDDSYAVVRRLRDPRIRLYRNERNLGVSRTRNRGIDLMRGGYMAPMDADDVCTPRRLELPLRKMQQWPHLGVCGGWTLWRGWGGASYVGRQPGGPEAFRAYLLYGMPAQHDTLLFRSDVLRTHGLTYDESLAAAVDFDLLARCMAVTEGDNVPAVLVHYFRNATGISHTRTSEQAKQRLRLLRGPLERLLPGRVDEAGLRRHAHIGNGGGAETPAELVSFRQWLETLEAANRERAVFDPEGLRRATAMVWFRCCRNSAHLGAAARRAWKRSSWRRAYRPALEEEASWAGSRLLARLVPARRHAQGHIKGL